MPITQNSKMIRISEHLAAEVQRLAKEERRSMAQMVEILLEQALKLDAEGLTAITDDTGKVVGAAAPARPAVEDRHFKPDFK